jgi:hypothetical protein
MDYLKSIKYEIGAALAVFALVALIVGSQMAYARINNPGISGVTSIANGGTATSTGGVTNGIEFFDGAKITNNANLTTDGNGTLTTGSGATLWTYGPNSSLSNALTFTSAGMTYPALTIGTTGNVGLSSTSPDALLSIMDTGGYASVAPHLVFEIGSSTTGTATSTLFQMNNSGQTTILAKDVTPNYLVVGNSGLSILSTTPFAADGGSSLLFGGFITAGGVNYASIEGRKVSSSGGGASGYLKFTTDGGAGLIEAMRITSTQTVGIGTTTPIANFQVTVAAANATTSASFGKKGQNKGTCLTFYDAGGTAVYGFIPVGATAFSYTTTKPSGCQD